MAGDSENCQASNDPEQVDLTRSLSIEDLSARKNNIDLIVDDTHPDTLRLKTSLNSMEDVTESVSLKDIVVYLARQNHKWLISRFPITFGDCSTDLLERNVLAARNLCSELSNDCRNLTDEEIINQIVYRLKSSEPLEFTVSNLYDYLTSGDHNRLIRTYLPFVACTRELLERNFSFVFARCLNMRQGGCTLSDKQFQELIDLMRSPKRRRCP